MKRVLAVVFAALAVSAMAMSGIASAKECKQGKILDPDTGKCVVDKGS